MRLWRMRRRHEHIDATLSVSGPPWELMFVRNRRPMLMWRFPDQGAARTEAEARRRALERAGWTSHW